MTRQEIRRSWEIPTRRNGVPGLGSREGGVGGEGSQDRKEEERRRREITGRSRAAEHPRL